MSATEQKHEHAWEPVGTVKEEQVSYSPVSHMDHCKRTVTIAVRSCQCAALRRTQIGAGPWRWLNR